MLVCLANTIIYVYKFLSV